jgi:hypothetical protein
MTVFNLLIRFKTGEDKVIAKVSNYGICNEKSVFYYEKNGYKSFIPVDSVIFIGREFDYLEVQS